jgi:two-component system, NarL family, response regulator DevR
MKVLIVDDSMMIRKRLIKMLNPMRDIQIVGEAEDAKNAIDCISQLKPDVVILDLQLQSGTGFQVLESQKNREAAPVIIILTNFSDPEYRAKCLADGADFFFEKATAFHELSHVFNVLMPQPTIT